MKHVLKIFGRIFGVFFLIVFIYVVVMNVRSCMIGKPDVENAILDSTMMNTEIYEDSLKDQESDIAGMTKLDKYKEGLNPADGSDTDGDGLTDKEEIEVYGSDPTKKSTAGDLYEDGYKVKHDMDVKKKYDYKEEYKFKWNDCTDFVDLVPTCADDFYAVVEDCSSTERVDNNVTFYKAFMIYNYSGNVTFKLDKLAKKIDKEVDDLAIYYREIPDTELSETKTRDEDKNGKDSEKCLTTKMTLEHDYKYMFYIMNEKSFWSKLSFDSMSAKSVSSDYVEGSGLAYGFTFTRFFGNSMNIWYTDTHVDAYNQKAKKKLVNYVNKLSDDELTVDSDSIKQKEQDEIEKKYNFLHKYFGVFELEDPMDYDWYHIFFAFNKYDFSNSAEGSKNGQIYIDEDVSEAAKEKSENGPNYIKEHFGFDEFEDELPFENFSTSDVFCEEPHGNCSGFAHLASTVFTGKAKKKGSYTDTNGNTLSWDLTKDEENKTLYDKGLYDYQSTSYVADHTDPDKGTFSNGLNSADTEFMKMIQCYWKESNDILKSQEHTDREMVCTNGQNNLSYDLIERMKKALDKGHVLEVGMTNVGFTSGHMVNVVGYTEDGPYTSFKVYDSNIPQSLNTDGTYFWTGIDVLRVKSDYGHKDSFEFIYQPAGNGSDYLFTSYAKYGVEHYYFEVMDEDWNVLN